MAPQGKARAIDGWLIVDKPAGMTSTEVVGKVRRLLGVRKLGHGGTLDPLATGVLPIALGEATKTVAYVMEGAKRYHFTLRWGQATDTDDAEGAVIAETSKRPSHEEIEAALSRFRGRIRQVPPLYSAIKIAGTRAYDLAREGARPTLEAREVRIDGFRLLRHSDPDHADFEVECGKGAYMRALARDLGEALGTKAHIRALRRLQVGPFTQADTISLDSLAALGQGPAATERVLPIETALDDIPALALTESEALRLRNGQALSLLSRSHAERIQDLEPGGIVCAMMSGKLVALSRFEAGELRPVRVLQTSLTPARGAHDVDLS